MKKTKANKNNEKKPFYKKGWFWALIIFLMIFSVVGTNDDEVVLDDVDSSVTESIAETTEQTSIDEDKEELEIEITAGEKGEYGRLISYNKGTEFEEEFYAFYVPAGTYTVTNKGEYIGQFNIYSDEIVKNSSGWDEPKEIFGSERFNVGESKTITIEKGQHIEIVEPDVFLLEKKS